MLFLMMPPGTTTAAPIVTSTGRRWNAPMSHGVTGAMTYPQVTRVLKRIWKALWPDTQPDHATVPS